jgi:hypothetical protein
MGNIEVPHWGDPGTGGGGGGHPPAHDPEGLVHAARGYVAGPSPAGMPIVVGDKNTPEVVAPVDYLFGSVRKAIVSDIAAMIPQSGGAGGGTTIVYIGGEQLDGVITKRMDAGFIQQPKSWR